MMGLVITVVVIGVLISVFVFVIDAKKKDEDTFVYAPVFRILQGLDLELQSLVNEHREKIGLLPLKSEAICYDLAWNHNERMVKEGKVNHNLAYERKMWLFDIGFDLYGEIVGGKYVSVDSLFASFLRSDKHRQYIENADFNYCGISVGDDGDGRVYATVIFARYKKD